MYGRACDSPFSVALKVSEGGSGVVRFRPVIHQKCPALPARWRVSHVFPIEPKPGQSRQSGKSPDALSQTVPLTFRSSVAGQLICANTLPIKHLRAKIFAHVRSVRVLDRGGGHAAHSAGYVDHPRRLPTI